MTLAAIVVFTTTYAMILPALSMDVVVAQQDSGIGLESEDTTDFSSEGQTDADTGTGSAGQNTDTGEAQTPTAADTDSAATGTEPDTDDDFSTDEPAVVEQQTTADAAASTLTAEIPGATVTLAFDAEAGVPEGSILTVTALTQEEAGAYRNAAQEKADASVSGSTVTTAQFYRLALTHDEETVTPDGDADIHVDYAQNLYLEQDETAYAVVYTGEASSYHTLLLSRNSDGTATVAANNDAITAADLKDYSISRYGDVFGIVSVKAPAAENGDEAGADDNAAADAIEDTAAEAEKNSKETVDVADDIDTEKVNDNLAAENETQGTDATAEEGNTTEDEEAVEDQNAAGDAVEVENTIEDENAGEEKDAAEEVAAAADETDAQDEDSQDTEKESEDFDAPESLTEEDAQAGITELDLGDVVIRPVDEELLLPADTEGHAEVLEGTEADEAQTVVEEFVNAQNALKASKMKKAAKRQTLAAATAATDQSEQAYQVFDIALENVDAEEYKGGFEVEVSLPENIIGKDFHLYHIHDGETEEIAVDLDERVLDEESGVSVVSGFTFETANFSEFVLKYTVDFEYNGETVIVEGGKQVLLSTLLSLLHLSIETDDIANVSFSSEHLVSIHEVTGEVLVNDEVVTVEGKDYLLSSLEPFTTLESLVITLEDGTTLVINVTDAQSLDLNKFLTTYDVLDDRQTSVITDGNKIITTVNGNYYLSLHFAETSDLQFDNNATLDFTVPDGVELNNSVGTGTSIDIAIGSRVITGNTVSIVEINGKKHVQVKFNENHRNFSYLATSPNVSFDLLFGVSFNLTTISKSFKDDESGTYTIEVQNKHNASVEKTGYYDENDGKMHYKVIVHSTDGDSDAVSLLDTVTGSAITLNNSVNVYYCDQYGNLNFGESVDATTPTVTDKSLSLTINKVPKDKYVAVEYTADVDVDQIGKSGNASFSETGNTVKINVPGDDDTTDNESKHEESNIKFSSVKKEMVETGAAFKDGDKYYRLITYKVTANPERRASLKGSQITDLLSSNGMLYNRSGDYATGLKVYVYSADGVQVNGSPRTVSWNDLGISQGSETSWAYNVPADDGKYSYEVSYQVKVEVEESAQEAKFVKNTASTKHDNSTVEIPAKPYTEISTPSMKKVVDKVEGDEVTWKIIISVPANGYNQPYTITDTLPTMSTKSYVHDIVTDVSVTGTVEGDGYVPDTSVVIDNESNTDNGTKTVTVNFSGFAATGTDRIVEVSVKTKVNPEWLEDFRQSGAVWTYMDHTNTAVASSNGQNIGTSSPKIPIVPEKIRKETSNFSGGYVSMTTQEDAAKYNNDTNAMYHNAHYEQRLYYEFNIFVEGNTKDSLVISDYFDTNLFEVYIPSTMNYLVKRSEIGKFDSHGKVYAGVNPTTFDESGIIANITPTEYGAEIRVDKLPINQSTGFVYTYFKIPVFLIAKDSKLLAESAIKDGELIGENGNLTGNKITYINTADWNGNTGSSEFGYSITDVLKKDGSYDASKDEYTFTITLNPAKDIINRGINFDLTDTFENVTVISKDNITITAIGANDTSVDARIFNSKSEADTWSAENTLFDVIIAYLDTAGNKIIVEEIPDATSVVITYIGQSNKVAAITDGQAVETIQNDVEVLDYEYHWSKTNNYDFINKTKSNEVDENGYITFTIDFNANKLRLKNGGTIDITDAYTGNMVIDETSFNVVCDPTSSTPDATSIKSGMRTADYSDSYGTGKKYTFTVPDETHVTITYKGKPDYQIDESDRRGKITTDYRNTAEAENVPKVVTGGGEEYFLRKLAGTIESSGDYQGMIPFTIVFNPLKMQKNGGNPITLTDDFTNLLVEYSTVQIATEPSGTVDYDYSGTVGTFVVPDSTKVTITYYARPDFTDSSSVNWSNVVRASGFQDSSEGSSNEMISGEGRGDLGNILWLMKYESGHMSIKLSGVTFKLYMDDGNGGMTPVTREDGTQVTFTTEENNVSKGKGFVQMTLITPSGGSAVKEDFTDGAQGFKQDTIYYLEEVTPLEGYYQNSETYNFVLHDTTKQVPDPNDSSKTITVRTDDYVKPTYMAGKRVYVFGRDDIVKVSNEKITQSVSIQKYWVNADGTWSWPSDIQSVKVKLQKKDGSTLTDLTGTNVPSYYLDDNQVQTGEDGSVWSDTLDLTSSASKGSWNHLDLPGENDTWEYVVSEVSVTTTEGNTFNISDGQVTVTVNGHQKIYHVGGGSVTSGKATVTNMEETLVDVQKQWNGVPSSITFDKPAEVTVVDTNKLNDGKVTISKSDLIVRVRLHRYVMRVGDRLDSYDYADSEQGIYVDLTSPDWEYTWNNLPSAILENGTETDYSYEVEEVMVTVPKSIMHKSNDYVDISDLFANSTSRGENGEFIISNSLANDVNWYLDVTKTWTDANDQETTGGTVQFKLLRDSITTTEVPGTVGSSIDARWDISEDWGKKDLLTITPSEGVLKESIAIGKNIYITVTPQNDATPTEYPSDLTVSKLYSIDNSGWIGDSKNIPGTREGNRVLFKVPVTSDLNDLACNGNTGGFKIYLKVPHFDLGWDVNLTVGDPDSTSNTSSIIGEVLKPSDLSDPYNGEKLVVDSTGNYTFTLTPGETVSFPNLPWTETSQDGNTTSTYVYKVVETTTGDFSTTVTYGDGTKQYYDPTPSSGTKGVNGTVSIVNKTNTTYDSRTVGLKIKKIDDNGTAMSGVSFKLMSGTTQVDSGTTATDGTLTLNIDKRYLGTDASTNKVFTLVEEPIPTNYSSDSPWTVTVAGDGTETVGSVVYTKWKIQSVVGYSGASVDADSNLVYSIENKELTQVSAKKTWFGSETWPTDMAVTLQIKQFKGESEQTGFTANATDNTNATSVTINSQQTVKWTNLPKYYTEGSEVKEYSYQVFETAVKYGSSDTDLKSQYTVTGEGAGTNGLVTIDNTPATITVSGAKTWIASGSHDNAADVVLKLTRTANGTTEIAITVSGTLTWVASLGEGAKLYQPTWSGDNYTYSNLPQYSDVGQEYTYEVAEASFTVGGTTYTVTKSGSSYTVSPAGKFTVTQNVNNITNTELTEFEFSKVWTVAGATMAWTNQPDIQVKLERIVGTDDTTKQNTSYVTIGKNTESVNVMFDSETYTITRESTANSTYRYKVKGLSKYKDDDTSKPWTYKIIEQQVSGYNKPKYFTKNDQGTEVEKHSADNLAVAAGTTGGVKIVNDQITVSLPATGGSGTLPFTLSGMLLLAFAAIAYIYMKRRTLFFSSATRCGADNDWMGSGVEGHKIWLR